MGALALALVAVAVAQAAGPPASAATQDFSLSLECSPLSVESGEDVTCTAAVLFDADRRPVTYAWTPAGEAGAGDDQRVFRFDTAGEPVVSVRACLADGGERPDAGCKEATARITVDGTLIRGLVCAPSSVNDRQSSTCRLQFADQRADIAWTAGPNAVVPALMGGTEFTTGFTRPDVTTVTARACVSSASRAEPRCEELSTTVEVTQGPFPAVRSLSCAPDILTPGQTVSCTATVENEPDRLVWYAFGGIPDTGMGLTFATSFADVGGASIQLTACVTGLGEPRCDTAQTVVRVAMGAQPPRIRTPGCAPDLVPVNTGIVVCRPEVTGGQESFTWTAGPDAAPAQASGQNPSFRFTQPGTKTITLRVCAGTSEPGGSTRPEACDELSQPITVTSTAPGVEAVTCSPAATEAGRPVTCTARAAGATPATWAWTVAGGTPAGGSGASFTTTFATAGRYAVRVEACVSDRCGSGEATVTVSARTAASLNGRFSLQQADGGNCNPTYSPVTDGMISFQVTYPESPTEPARVTGSLTGGGSGTVSWRCDGLTGSAAWTQSYRADFTGTVDRTTGAVISISGTIRGSRTVRHSNCRKDGRTEACPANDSNSYSFPLRLTGTLREGGGGMLFVDQIALRTTGSWTVQ